MTRLATPGERGAVEEIVRLAYAKWAELIGIPPKPLLSDYEALIAAERVWVADPLDALIVLIPEKDVLLVDNVAVHPSHQGKGVGRTLLAFAEERARTLSLPALRLYTNQMMTTNIALYQSLGYQETGRETSDGRGIVHMRKHLS
jgi:GNAT superfamily N-acetyltransferase